MTMPTITCPVCRNQLTWETIFAHEGVREAMVALVNAHPSASKLLRPLLGYVGLFAPEKRPCVTSGSRPCWMNWSP